MSDSTRFLVSMEADCYLAVEDIWPDGDAPENPTPADVKAVMEKCGRKVRVLDEWELLHDLKVEVCDRRGRERVEVWSVFHA